jgi:hypothetical protein
MTFGTGNGMNLNEALNILGRVQQHKRRTVLATIAVGGLALTASLLFLGAAVVLGSLSVYGLYHLGAFILG